MEKELFRTIIAESQEYIGRIHLVQRPLYLEEYGNYVFVGVRQAGKSYLLYQRIQQLLTNGVDIEDIVYVNFDDERLQGMSVADFDFILQAYHSMCMKVSPSSSLMRYRMLKGGRTLHAV